MQQYWAIWHVSPETRLKGKILAMAKGQTIGELITKMIDEAYNADDTILSDKKKRVIRRVIRRTI